MIPGQETEMPPLDWLIDLHIIGSRCTCWGGDRKCGPTHEPFFPKPLDLSPIRSLGLDFLFQVMKEPWEGNPIRPEPFWFLHQDSVMGEKEMARGFSSLKET